MQLRHLLLCVVILVFCTNTVFARAARRRHLTAIPGRVLVVLNHDLPLTAAPGVINSLQNTFNLDVPQRFLQSNIFVVQNVSENVIDQLRDDPRVEEVEDDFPLLLSAVRDPTWLSGNYLWGLDRLDDATYSQKDSRYEMCPDGSSVVAYLIDSGVRASHEQFMENGRSRVVQSWFFDQLGHKADSGCGSSAAAWHGTATASLLTGRDVGSSRVDVVSLRTSQCTGGGGSVAGVIGALDWIHGPEDSLKTRAGVVNLSAGLPPFDGQASALNEAVTRLVRDRGVPFFAAADNYSGDACMFYPNNLAYTRLNKSGRYTFVVGGSSVGANPNDLNDYRWQTWRDTPTGQKAAIGLDTGSDGGACVSAYAPACAIYVATNASDSSYNLAQGLPSGTSFSSPLTAGIAARYIEKYMQQHANTQPTPAQVYDYLLSTPGAVVNNVDTPEYWLCYDPTTAGKFLGLDAYGTCPTGYEPTPLHVPATHNESNARMIYSDMTCP